MYRRLLMLDFIFKELKDITLILTTRKVLKKLKFNNLS